MENRLAPSQWLFCFRSLIRSFFRKHRLYSCVLRLPKTLAKSFWEEPKNGEQFQVLASFRKDAAKKDAQ